ncbi:MAG: OFA family MFS transporter [Sedimentisphaerales bacterium]|nr:OFA family MFS transporter [Sedimentisphaerales bacterium]
MAAGRVMNRWIVVVGGIVVQLCLGAIYAWSAFTKKLTLDPYAFTMRQTQIIFSVGLLTFAIVMAMIAGNWQKRVGPRKVATVGGLVLGLGYILAGLSGSSFVGILLGVGILGGAGIGLAYVCPIAALVKWFPNKKGMITGLAVAGFGFGALLWIMLTGGFKFGPWVDLTPGWNGLYGMGWSVNKVFILYGILFAGLVSLGSLVLVNPPEGWLPAGWSPQTTGTTSAGSVSFTVGQMVRTYQYWILFMTFTVGALAGLMVIGIIKLFGMDRLQVSGVDATQAMAVTNTAMGLFYALLNGLGRIVWGTVSDKLGRKHSIVLMSLLQGVVMIAFYYVGGYEWGLYIGAAIIGFNFGGNFALFPAATADLFGNKTVGVNYPFVFLAYGIGGVVGPILGGTMGDRHAWMWAFIPAGIACVAAAAWTLAIKPVDARAAPVVQSATA